MGPIARYDPYGGPRPSTTLPAGIGFAGEWADATGLVDLRARAYDPSLQSFLTRDPVRGVPAVPATGAPYAYALGDPLRHTDPSGRFVAALGGMPGGLLEALGLGGAPGPLGPGAPFVNPGCLTGQYPVCRDGYPVTAYVPRGQGFDLGGWFDVALDAVGFVPVVGDAVDLGRAGFDAARWALTGDENAGFQALLNAGAAVPWVGSLGKQALKHADEVADVVTGVARVERRAATSKIYSARVLERMADEPGPLHNFPGSFDDVVFSQGTRTVQSDFYRLPRANLGPDSVQYMLPGSLNGRTGSYEIFTRPSTSGRTEVVMHRFFRPDK
ncbi:MAG: RHS repeat-associated core domain-containing protein [Chloroflexota bacterium]